MKINKAFYIISTLVVLAGVRYWAINKQNGGFKLPENPLVAISPSEEGDLENPAEPLVALGKGEVRGKRYVHEKPFFSFDCAGCSPGDIRDDMGETILLKNFQIYITPQEEQFDVTRERIQQDAPDVIVEGAKSVVVQGAKALVFKSKDASGSSTREVWFTHEGYLYQITGSPDAELEMSAVVGSWKF